MRIEVKYCLLLRRMLSKPAILPSCELGSRNDSMNCCSCLNGVQESLTEKIKRANYILSRNWSKIRCSHLHSWLFRVSRFCLIEALLNLMFRERFTATNDFILRENVFKNRRFYSPLIHLEFMCVSAYALSRFFISKSRNEEKFPKFKTCFYSQNQTPQIGGNISTTFNIFLLLLLKATRNSI